MPSLSALGEFRFSFNNIANEKNDVLAKKLPFDDLQLPGTEAPPMELLPRDSFDSGEGEDDPLEAGSDAGGGFDFNAFFGDLSSEIGAPSLDEPPSIDDLLGDSSQPPVDDFFENTDQSSFDETVSSDDTFAADSPIATDDDLSVMEEELTGLLDINQPVVEETPVDSSTGFTAEDFDSPDSGEADLDDPGVIDLGGESPFTGFDSDTADNDLSAEPSDSGDFGDFTLPDDMISEGVASFDADDVSKDPEGVLDLSQGIDLGGESLLAETPAEDFPSDDFSSDDFGGSFDSLQDTDFSGSPSSLDDTSSLGDEPSFEDTTSLGDSSSFEAADFDSSLPDTSGFDSSLPDTSSSFEDSDFGSGFDSSLPDTDFSGMDFGTDGELTSESGFDEAGGADPFENMDFGGELGSVFETDSIELDSEPDLDSKTDEANIDFGNDEFALPGLEDIFDKGKSDILAKPAQKKGFFRRRKAKAAELPEAEADIEEIQLTQDNLDSLLRTLAAYPLNLRIVCEEMIAEQVLLPKQLSKLIRLLVNGAHIKEAAALAEEITGKQIVIPKSFEKMTGAAFEAEQASFAYIFVHNFLPVLRLFAVIAAMAASVAFLGYRFVYIPIKAESIYKRGYERIPAGEYQRANQLFNEAFSTHRKKKWFYLYAEAFRDQRRYMLAEEKYDELLLHYPRDKKGVLDYARLNTYYLLNYDKANRLLQQQLLDYSPNDYEGLLAAGDNFLLWADSDPSRFYDRYEDARFSYARLLERYGWRVPIVERMLIYFIRTDNLKEVLHLRAWFENDRKRNLSAAYLSELGGYLLDKQLEEVSGVPDPYVESIESVRAMLLQAVREDPMLPEPHYHLARYHHALGNTYEERLTLENAIRAFDLAETETVRRRLIRVDAHYRYANLLVNNREFFPAEEQLIRGIQLYEDFLSRNLIRATPQIGQLYAAKGDLEYFVKSGDMTAALNDYHRAERYGWSPPEIQYRMGAAYYQLGNWGSSLEYLFRASAELPMNRRLLYALGNVTYQRGDFFAAEGYYNRLLDILENQRIRLPVLLPNDNPQFLELGERLMMARNNAGVVYEALADQTGNREYRSKALVLYSESSRAWDSITRNPETMIRMRLTDTPGAPGINLGYLNANNALRPGRMYTPEIFVRIDKDVLEPSRWEELAPFGGLQ